MIPRFIQTPMKLHLRNTGFTLIELLAAVSIIAILSAVGIAAFAGVQRNTRDQQRLRDLGTLKQALEMYRGDERSYPFSLDDLPATYLDPRPTDPVTGVSYQYQPSFPLSSCTTEDRTCTGFLLCAKKEGNGSFEYADECAASDLTCRDTAGDCDIGASSP